MSALPKTILAQRSTNILIQTLQLEKHSSPGAHPPLPSPKLPQVTDDISKPPMPSCLEGMLDFWSLPQLSRTSVCHTLFNRNPSFPRRTSDQVTANQRHRRGVWRAQRRVCWRAAEPDLTAVPNCNDALSELISPAIYKVLLT